MLTFMLAALTAVSSAAPVTSAPHPAPLTVVINEPTRSAEHIARARKALESGDLAEARREYVIATALDRDAGALPIESSFGLAQVLFSQAQDKDAARVLDQLADDAQRRGDVNTEARALIDAAWLHLSSNDRYQARANGQRLRELRRDARLNETTRAYLDSRVR